MTKEKIIIDTDPGCDDATGITLLLNSNKVDIKLITTSAGILDIDSTTRNLLYILERFNKQIPVCKGAPTPLFRKAKYVPDIQGKYGLGGFIPPKVNRKVSNEDSIDAMYKVIKENPHEITFLELAPQTNLARLFLKYPDSESLLKQIIFEGGSPFGREKVKPHISFNISFDPESAKIVMESKTKKTIIPSELGRYYVPFSEEQVEEIKHTNKTGEFFATMYKGYKSKYVNATETNDVNACMYLLYPEIYSTNLCSIKIDLEETPGKTIITDNDGDIIFVNNVDKEKFYKFFMENLKCIK